MNTALKSQIRIVRAIVSTTVALNIIAFAMGCDSTVRIANTAIGGHGGASPSSSSGGSAASSSSSGGGILNDAGIDADAQDAAEACTGVGTWYSLSTTNEPHCRENFAAAWTGTDLLIWGGRYPILELYVVSDGARYRSNADTWTAMPDSIPQLDRFAASSVWTGDRWVIWGGANNSGTSVPTEKAGASYDPLADAWTTISSIGAPTKRMYHTAIWSGSEMIVWGGFDNYVDGLGDGGRYSPITDTWNSMNPVDAPGHRNSHTAIWTGSEMIVWGGINKLEALGDGAVYNPTTDQWRPMSMIGAPSARYEHTVVWTGSEMVIWGGRATNPDMLLGDGARYDPQTDTWSSIAMAGAPTPRKRHTAVWTGSKMLVWGGHAKSETADWEATNTGGIYDLQSETWTPTSMCAPPEVTAGHAAVWTGSEMTVWGGNGCAHGHRFVP